MVQGTSPNREHRHDQRGEEFSFGGITEECQCELSMNERMCRMMVERRVPEAISGMVVVIFVVEIGRERQVNDSAMDMTGFTMVMIDLWVNMD